MSRRNGLGKGLDSLIPQSIPKSMSDKKIKGSVFSLEDISYGNIIDKQQADIMIDINLIEPNSEQPRKVFDEDALNELAESIKQHGVIQPLLLVKKDTHYEIVAGERRWRAAKIAGLKEVPAIVKELTEQEIMEISLIENLQREDLNPIEEALAYQKLMQEFHMTQDELAKKVAKSRAAVANTIRLLKLDSSVQTMLSNGQISSGHARALLGLDNMDEQYDIAVRIIEEHLSVRETEELVRILNEPIEKIAAKDDENNPLEEQKKNCYKNYENMLKDLMGTKVNIKNKKNDKGKIEIEYYSLDELERLLELFQHMQE